MRYDRGFLFQGLCLVLMGAAMLLAPPGASAQALLPGRAFNPRTPRALGMGNAQVAIGGDYNSLFYNPAGLATVEDMEIQAASVLWESNKDSPGLIADAFNLTAPADIAAFANAHEGDPIFVRANSISYVTLKKSRVGIGAALLFDYTLEQSITDGDLIVPGADTIQTRRNTDVGGVIGASVDVIEEWLALGANLKVYNRWNAFSDANPGTVGPGSSFDGEVLKPFGRCGSNPGCVDRSELGVGVDLGMLFMLPFEEIPALGELPAVKGSRLQAGLVWQDVGDTRFDSGDIAQTLDLGLAYIQSIVIGDLKFGLDIRDLNRNEIDVADKLSLGAELAFNKFVTLRAGLNETGAAVGATLRLWVLRFEGGFFQEKTDLPSRGRDERFFVSMGVGWYN